MNDITIATEDVPLVIQNLQSELSRLLVENAALKAKIARYEAPTNKAAEEET